MNTLLTFGGVLESLTGLALLLAPATVATLLLCTALAGPALVVARLAGAGLLALGVSFWGARADAASSAGLAVAWAFVLYNLVASLLLARARPPVAGGGLPALAAALLHGALGLAMLGLLLT